MRVIPDPLNPEGPAIADDGRLAHPVFFRPSADGTEPPTVAELRDRSKWKHVGWSTDGVGRAKDADSEPLTALRSDEQALPGVVGPDDEEKSL